MNAILDMFSVLTGVQVIFKLGFVPKDDELYELTSEQYPNYYDRMVDDDTPLDEKIYMILPKNTKKYKELASEDVFALTESDIYFVKKGEQLIEKYCVDSGKTFHNFEEKLYYVASVLPPVASDGKETIEKDDN